jgi:hypothetical protein
VPHIPRSERSVSGFGYSSDEHVADFGSAAVSALLCGNRPGHVCRGFIES